VKDGEKGAVGPEGVAVGEAEDHRPAALFLEFVRVGGGEAQSRALGTLFDRVDDGRAPLQDGVQRGPALLGG